MTLQALTPMLRTPDLRGTIAFYTEVLGFTCENVNDDWGWAALRSGPVEIMLSSLNAHQGDVATVFTPLAFSTCDVDVFVSPALPMSAPMPRKRPP